MKSIKYLAILFFSMLTVSCSKYLNETPQGVISSQDLETPTNTDAQVIACYSSLGNDHYYTPWSSMWAYGSIRSGDAYKGGGGPGDISDFNALEVFNQVNPTWGTIDQAWYQIYVGIAYCNSTLQLINGLTDAQYPNKVERTAEVRFLRGHFYFLLKIMFNRIPWIDETIAKANYGNISNTALTSDQLWTNIENDFGFAEANLPVTQSDLGRATKGAAQAYLAKALIYHAYTQDATYSVTGIDQTKMNRVNTLCDSVINSNVYSLMPDVADNFLPQFRNNPESVFSIQYSNNDGTVQGREPIKSDFIRCGFLLKSAQLKQLAQLEQPTQLEQLEQLKQPTQLKQLEQLKQLKQLEQLEQLKQLKQLEQLPNVSEYIWASSSVTLVDHLLLY